MAKTMEEVLERFRTIEFHDDFDMIVAIANGGIIMVPAVALRRYVHNETDMDWLAGLRHAEKIGLGTMDYELIKI